MKRSDQKHNKCLFSYVSHIIFDLIVINFSKIIWNGLLFSCKISSVIFTTRRNCPLETNPWNSLLKLFDSFSVFVVDSVKASPPGLLIWMKPEGLIMKPDYVGLQHEDDLIC